MGVQKRGPQRYEATIYIPRKLRKEGETAKRYIGARKLRKDAVQLFEDAKRDLRGKPPVDQMQVREYADRWLEFKHGPGTRRPKASTHALNRQQLKQFLDTYADRTLDGIPRHEALDWCVGHRNAARVVSAMFNDAVNDGLIAANPFANRQQEQSRGRKDIEPITEAEVERLGEIAVDIWGTGYGLGVRAWILFSAWVGTRPGETFGLEWSALDFEQGLVTVTRVKPPYNTDVIVFPGRAQTAVLQMAGGGEGLVFRTIQGKRFKDDSHSRYWDAVRTVFEVEVGRDRKLALRGGQPTFALYSMRHFCASVIVARGGNEFDVAAQLGNSPEMAREVYIHDYKLDRQERLRQLLDGGSVSSLDAKRKMRGA